MKPIRNLSLAVLWILSIFLQPVQEVSAGTRYYVKANGGNDNNNGTSWNSAFATLNKALLVAQDGDEIWVAKGTYYPSLTDTNASFTINKNLSLYGGFAGTETNINQRIISANPTILSGEIQGDGNLANNIVYVITLSASGAVLLDGFTVTGGYDAGIYVVRSTCTAPASINNAVVTNNSKGYSSLYNCNVNISNSTFSYNAKMGIRATGSGNLYLNNVSAIYNGDGTAGGEG